MTDLGIIKECRQTGRTRTTTRKLLEKGYYEQMTTKHPTNEYNSPEEDAELGFNKWFYEDFYGRFSFRYEYFMDDIKIEDENQRKDVLIKWLNSAFLSGYKCALYKQLEEEV